MSQQFPWGSSNQQQNARRGLTPISTAFTSSSNRTAPSASSPSRNAFSPGVSNQPSSRHIASRHSSVSSSSSPFSPSQTGSQQHQPGQLLSSARSRIIPSSAGPQQASSAAALPTATQGGGAASSGGGGGTAKLARASPSLSQSSGVGSPITSSNPITAPSSQSLSKIVIAQVFLLLSSIKEDKDKAKWESQADQIKKLIDSHGMDVYTKYFRRLLQGNAAQVFPASGRNGDSSGSYPLLVAEMQKIMQDPQQAQRIAESIDTPEGDLFRDFDLSVFTEHFKLDPFAKTMLALACKSASKPDLRTKADAILTNNYQNFLVAVTKDNLAPSLLASILDRLIGDPPRGWNEESKSALARAVRMRYQMMEMTIPAEVSAALHLLELLDASNPLVQLVHRAGPRATMSFETCRDMLQLAETRDISYTQVASVLLYMVITQDGQAYDPAIFVAALREHRAGGRLDWQDVVHGFDRMGLQVTKKQFLALYHALLPLAQDYENFDIQLLWGGSWNSDQTQLSFVVAFLSCGPDELDVSRIPRLRRAFTLEDFETASEDVRSYAEKASKHPFVSLDATAGLFGNIFRSNEAYQNAQNLGTPVNIINASTDIFVVAASAIPKPWGGLQEQALKQLFPPFFKKDLPSYNFVLHGLWKKDSLWLAARLVDVYAQDLMTLPLIFEHAQEHGWVKALIAMNEELSVDLAAFAHSRGLLDLQDWMQETLQTIPQVLPRVLQVFLRKKAEYDLLTQRDVPPTTVGLSVKTVYTMLEFLQSHLSDEELVDLQRTCIQAYPRLVNYGEGFDEIIDTNGKHGNAISAETDAKMQEHFKKMYSLESDVRDIIEALQKYKTSEDPADQDLFACMIAGLFDEYNCFGEYPLEALATTAVLFGGIINYHLLPRVPLQTSLAMVLDAVQEYAPEDSMYKFGLQALLHFANRLQEWPNYCERLLQVPGLAGTEIWNKAEEIVRGPRGADANGELQNGVGMPNGNVDELLGPSVPRFTCLHVDPPLRPDLYVDPDEDIQDKVLFVLNNVSERNLNDKLKDLKEALQEKHHQWFAAYLVDERAKLQPNFQQLFLDMLQLFNDRTLWAEVLRETYVAVINMLNADSTLNSSSERTHLKNLAGWLGSLTIARDKPIKFKNISFKDLLVEGYDTHRLLIVIPFTCKVLVQAARSIAFRPPNPWTMEIIRLLMELYHFAELKLNLKFEIEVLCKGLDLDHKTIEPSDAIRSRPLPDDEYLEPSIPEGLEGFNDLSLMSLNRPRGPSERFSPANITASLPDLGSQLVYPPLSSRLVGENRLRQVFLSAAQQAVLEIISPVVERSVTIAAISASQLVTKDLATEPDENRLRDAANNMVKALSGSLALVTCKEPLRMSITNHIRLMARELPEQALPEGLILMFVNDNLDTVCSIVENAAENQSIAEIEMHLEDGIRARRIHRTTRPDASFMDPPVSRWAFYIPDPYKQAPGGLNAEQVAIYEDFGRQMRGSPAHPNNASQDNGRQILDVLHDRYPSAPSLPMPAETPTTSRQGLQQQQRLINAPVGQAPQAQSQLNGYMEPHSLADRVQDLLAELQHATREAPEEHIKALPATAPTREVYEHLIHLLETVIVQKDPLSFGVANKIIGMIYTEAERRLEVEVMVQLLVNLCQISVQIGKHTVLTLTNVDDDRIFNVNATLCLLNVGLLDIRRVDMVIAKAIRERNVLAVEFFASFVDHVLLSEHPSALRTDFARSLESLSQWLAENPELEAGNRVAIKLQAGQAADGLPTPPPSSTQDQLEYVFDEWVHLLRADVANKSIAAFIHQLHEQEIIKTQEGSAVFLRVCIDASVAAYEQEEAAHGSLDNAYVHVDALARLIVSLVTYQGEADGAIKSSKAAYLESILSLVVLMLCHHHRTRGEHFNQKFFYRLFSSLLCELHSAKKCLPGFPIEIMLVMSRAFLALQPRFFPGFAFAWLALISHRMFMPPMVRMVDQAGWDTYERLVEALFAYVGELLKPTESSTITRDFYRGTLRFLLLLHHDFPEFLIENHFRLASVAPVEGVQLRNLVISAYPSNFPELPDPFTAGLKVDRLEEVRQTPTVRGDFEGLLRDAGIKGLIDNLLQTPEQNGEDVGKICRAMDLVDTTEDRVSVNMLLVNALVLYIGNSAVADAGNKAPIFNSGSTAAHLLEKLAKELHPEVRYHLIGAMVNQLRWPNSHTHYFQYAIIHWFSLSSSDQVVVEVQQQITRVLLERLLVHRPHPWGLIVTLLEILKDPSYQFWDLPFVKAAPEVIIDLCTNLPSNLFERYESAVERLFGALFQHINQSPRAMA